MELRQLRHFLALAQERSVTRAARSELIVQSGLSNPLQALERELGTPLYVRGTGPVRLTAAGEALAEQAVQRTRDVLPGTLRLGVSLSAQHRSASGSSPGSGSSRCPRGGRPAC